MYDGEYQIMNESCNSIHQQKPNFFQDTIINEVKPAVVSLYDYYNTDDK